MSLFKEFKEFALKGSVVDLAIGVVIGAAFSTVVKSFTDDILMPPISRLIGNRDMAGNFLALDGNHYDTLAQAKAAGVATINYGVFANNVVTFLIIAFAVFMVVKWFNMLRRKPAAEAPNTRECPQCLSAIPLAAARCKFCAQVV
jgi:large conductance mechanosensitive channel